VFKTQSGVDLLSVNGDLEHKGKNNLEGEIMCSHEFVNGLLKSVSLSNPMNIT